MRSEDDDLVVAFVEGVGPVGQDSTVRLDVRERSTDQDLSISDIPGLNWVL
jgi:hypothetical protein